MQDFTEYRFHRSQAPGKRSCAKIAETCSIEKDTLLCLHAFVALGGTFVKTFLFCFRDTSAYMRVKTYEVLPFKLPCHKHFRSNSLVARRCACEHFHQAPCSHGAVPESNWLGLC